MDIKINRTPEDTLSYPLHTHKNYEIMHYTNGTGVMRTEKGDFSFSAGTVVIVPPHVLHGSTSVEGFVNVSIEWDFRVLLSLDAPFAIDGTEDGEGNALIEMIWNNRCKNQSYLQSLCIAYVQCLLQKTKIENEMSACIKRIVERISECAFDPDTDVTAFLRQSGFAEDYVRARFKAETGMTPIGFLTELRIRQACYLIDIYRNVLSLSEIAERCGYTDYIYFSKRFKERMGCSPQTYKRI